MRNIQFNSILLILFCLGSTMTFAQDKKVKKTQVLKNFTQYGKDPMTGKIQKIEFFSELTTLFNEQEDVILTESTDSTSGVKVKVVNSYDSNNKITNSSHFKNGDFVLRYIHKYNDTQDVRTTYIRYQGEEYKVNRDEFDSNEMMTKSESFDTKTGKKTEHLSYTYDGTNRIATRKYNNDGKEIISWHNAYDQSGNLLTQHLHFKQKGLKQLVESNTFKNKKIFQKKEFYAFAKEKKSLLINTEKYKYDDSGNIYEIETTLPLRGPVITKNKFNENGHLIESTLYQQILGEERLILKSVLTYEYF